VLIRPTLLEDLQDHQVARPLEAEIGVLSDDVTHRMHRDDLVPIAVGGVEHLEHHLLHHVGEPAQLLGRAPLLDIDANQRHGGFLSRSFTTML